MPRTSLGGSLADGVAIDRITSGLSRTFASVLLLVIVSAVSVSAKKPPVSNEFDGPPSVVFDAVYRYAQHHGTIKWSDEKRFTLSGSMSVPGGNWDWRKDFDCTISVEGLSASRSAVSVVGTFPANQQSLVGAFREGPAVKILKGIRQEFDHLSKMPIVLQEPEPKSNPTLPRAEQATLEISSSPSDADIELDGSFSGNTPSSVAVVAGEHKIKISKTGYGPWERKVRSSSGTMHINAQLETTATSSARVASPPVSASSGNGLRENDPGKPTLPTPSSLTTDYSNNRAPTNIETMSSPAVSSGHQEAFLGAWSDEKPRVRRDGVIVSGTAPGGPADEAGIRPGDFILALNDGYVFTVEDLTQAIRQYRPGSKVSVRYRRYARIYDTYVIMGTEPESQSSIH